MEDIGKTERLMLPTLQTILCIPLEKDLITRKSTLNIEEKVLLSAYNDRKPGLKTSGNFKTLGIVTAHHSLERRTPLKETG